MTPRFAALVPPLLVAAQFGVLAALAVAGRFQSVTSLAVVFLVASAALGLAALAFNRPGNFNVRPLPRPGATLVTTGPYRVIRHPMYAALLLAGLAAVTNAPGPVTIALWLALAAVLGAKAVAEERGLAALDPAYREYMARTARFIPYLY